MKVDGALTTVHLPEVPQHARDIQALGYDGLFTFEGRSDPFLPLALAAEHTSRVDLMTAIALAFVRSPMALAYTAHDLQVQSSGRFILGLGAQIRTHVEKRYGAAYEHPLRRMHELVRALRAIWASWEGGPRLDFRGEFYRHTLSTPIFEPDPSPWGPPRIFLAAVQPRMTEAAGEVADGLIVHPLNSRRFIAERLLPAIERGRAKVEKTRDGFEVAVQVLVVTGASDEEIASNATPIRQQLAFYGSTPAYRPVLETHGWGDLQTALHALSKQGRWIEMGDLITDEMLDTFAIRGVPEELPGKLAARYGDLADRLSLVSYAGLERSDRDRWKSMLAAVRTTGRA